MGNIYLGYFGVLFFVFLCVGAEGQGELPIGTSKWNSAEEKEKWVKEHPEEYKAMIARGAAVSAGSVGEVFVDESAKKEAAHIAEKKKWIEGHAEEYRAMGGDPAAVLGVLKPQETDKKEASDLFLPFVAVKQYVLVGYDVVAAKGQQPTAKEIEEEKANLKKDMVVNSTELQIDKASFIRLYEPSRLDLRAFEKRFGGGRVEWLFEDKECKSCSKIINLRVEEETPTSLIYVLDDEDEGSLFAFRLSFQLITKP